MLELREITKRFGDVLANDHINIRVEPGTIHAIVGENGAGKSTAMRIAYGFYTADSGEIIVDGEPRRIETPHDAIALGIGMVHQHFMLVDTMSVAENIVLGAEPGSAASIDLRKAAQEIRALSDDVTVMRDGRVVGRLKTAETDAAELARMMVGRDVLLRVEKPDARPGGAVLSVKGLSVTAGGERGVRDVSFDVRAGEIVGVAGVEGNGQTELIEALAGLVTAAPIRGAVELGGRDITRASARERYELGIAHVPEDRHRRGLLLDFDLAENSILGVHYRKPAVSFGPLLDLAGIRDRALEIIRDFDVRPANPDLPARALSGGNQQKLIIGREFELRPKLLLVSQPTRGVDIGAIEFIHRKLVRLRDEGCAILLVSAELEEVTSLADRLLVIYHGRIVGEVDPKRTSQEEIGLMMTGGRKGNAE